MNRWTIRIAVLAGFFVAPFVPAAPPTTAPVTPSWIAKEPATWPQIRLTNKVVNQDNATGFPGSSGLTRLPNGVVVLVTARHLLGEAKPDQFTTAFKSWYAVVPPLVTAGVRMNSVAMDTSQPGKLDALVLLPASQQTTWPATVLNVRQEPLNVDDVIYLVGIPTDAKRRQAIHKGLVTKVRDDGSFEYAAEGKFPTTGNSGAPIVDAQGRLAAVNVAHLDNQSDPGKMLLVGIAASDILPQIKLPAGMKPLVLTPQPAVAGKREPDKGTNSGSATDEAEAAKQLEIVQAMRASGQPPQIVNGLLQLIVDKYPKTSAGKKAKAMLAAGK